MATDSQAKQQSAQSKPRVVPLANFPTIKVIQPPKGKFSPRNDQWCLTYCSQTVAGRTQHKQPFCRSICIRKVFTHEVQNILQFKSHTEVGPDGKARFPLPQEGQPINLPRYLGGKPVDDPEHDRRLPSDVRYWEEGWYLWKANGIPAVYHQLSQVAMDLPSLFRTSEARKNQQRLRQEYDKYVESGRPEAEKEKWTGQVVPPNLGDPAPDSLLIPIPFDSGPLLEPVWNVLAPARHSVGLLRENLKEGNFEKFGLRVWDKAWSGEPLMLASRAWNLAYDRWKGNDKDDEKGKKA